MATLIGSLKRSGKIPAFLVHLAISAALVAALAMVAYVMWYPPPYFAFDGGWNVMRILILVDVVLGPVLTLVVFRRGKPGLKRDLGLIAALQLSAFVYGAGLMVQYRPAFIVYAEKNFFSVPWPDLAPFTRDSARLEQMRASRGPTMVVLELPAEPVLRQRLRAAAVAGGPRITVLGDYYQPLTPERWRAMLGEAVNMDAQLRAQPEIADDLARFRARFLPDPAQSLENLAFFPAVLRYGVVMLALERQSGALFGWMNE
jgi:hypothetical protein